MPTYRYFCDKCNYFFNKNIEFQYRNTVVCGCGNPATKMPATSDQPLHVTERGDNWTGASTARDINEVMAERSRRNYIEDEAPRIREECGHSEVSEDVINSKGTGFKTKLDEK